MSSKRKFEYRPKARFKISKTGGPMKDKSKYTRKRKHKEQDNDA